jgi:hypothetical protein
MGWDRKRAVHHRLLVVIVDNFDIDCAGNRPAEADAVLVIDSDGMLPGACAVQCSEPLSRRDAKLLQAHCCVEQSQLVDGSLAQRSRDYSAGCLRSDPMSDNIVK